MDIDSKVLAETTQEVISKLTQRIAKLEDALKLGLEYWAHRQQRYKNRSPIWVERAREALKDE
jgi:BMFP domain-containing protein YqiC